MAASLKLGLVGADASGRGWGPVAHMPALTAIDSIELEALCTSRPESAAAAGEAHGIDRAYHDIGDLAAPSDLAVPDRLQPGPVSVPPGPGGKVARSYQRLADSITSGMSYAPDFDHAVELHRLLDTIERSSDEGRSIVIDPAAATGQP